MRRDLTTEEHDILLSRIEIEILEATNGSQDAKTAAEYVMELVMLVFDKRIEK